MNTRRTRAGLAWIAAAGAVLVAQLVTAPAAHASGGLVTFTAINLDNLTLGTP